MNIILINHYAGSPMHGMEYRPYYLAREWVDSGNRVKIVASSESHLRRNPPVVKGKIAFEEVSGIDYVWLKSPPYSGNGYKRAINLIGFAKSIYANRNKILGDFVPDLVIASSPHPFIIRGAKKFADQSKSKLIFEVRDLWPLSLIELAGMHPWHPFIALMQREEDFAYKHSDKIASLLPLAKDYMVGRGMHQEKFLFTPNGIDIKGKVTAEPLPEIAAQKIKALRSKYSFLVGFAGSHGVANALDSLINAAGLAGKADMGFVLVGKGDEKPRLIRQVHDMGLNNVLFLDEIDKLVVPSFLGSMDALYIGLKNHRLFRFGVSPNKLFDYMLSGKPVIYAIGSGNDPVAEAKCGVSCEPENPKEIYRAILKIKKMPGESRLKMGACGRDYVEKHHDYSILARDYLDAVR